MNMRMLIRVVVVALLGAVAALLVSCGSSGTGLIPAANAGPLQEDFEAVQRAAEAGDGNCATTESALGKTQQDFLQLPTTVDRGLHASLEKGIANLRKVALEMCVEPTSTATTSTSTSTSTPPAQTSTTSTTPPTTTPSTTTIPPTSTQTTSTTTTPPNPSGGTEAGGESGGEHGSEHGSEASPGAAQEGGGNVGANVGGASPGGGQ
jgi:hypothetical protein